LQINLNTEVQDRARMILAERIAEGSKTLTIPSQDKEG
jgi:hypothetical protein